MKALLLVAILVVVVNIIAGCGGNGNCQNAANVPVHCGTDTPAWQSK